MAFDFRKEFSGVRDVCCVATPLGSGNRGHRTGQSFKRKDRKGRKGAEQREVFLNTT